MPLSNRCGAGQYHRYRIRARHAVVTLATVIRVAVGLTFPSFAAAEATCSSTEAIACGDVKAGNVGAVGQTDCFEFTGEAGEVVSVLARSPNAAIQACAQLRDSAGAVMGQDACGQPATFTLPASGTYSLRLFDRSNDETGSYAVQLQVLSATPSSCPAALPCGASESGVVASVVQSNTYRFVAGEAGEVVSITATDTTAPFEACWQLYGADGSPIGTLQCNHDVRTLPSAGPYTIRVFDLANDETGTYGIDVNVVSATAASCPETTLACGETHGGGIAAIGDNDVYWFTTTSRNEVVDITTATTSGTMNTCWQLYAADGTAVGGIVCGHKERVIATPGTYVLRVFDLTYDGAGTYEVSAKTSPACPATPTPTPTPTSAPTPSSEPTPGASDGDDTPTPASSPSDGGSPGGETPTPGGGDPTATPNGAATATAPTSTGPTAGPGGGPTPQGTPSVQALESILDDFLCYGAKLTRGGPPFTPALGMRLSDPLESMRFDVRKPTLLCAPADRDGSGITDPATSLERYRLQRERRAPRFHRSTRQVATSLGTLSLDTIKPDQLLMPTQSALAQPMAPNATHQVDRYKCYKVRVTRKTPKLPYDLQVTVTDVLSSPGRRFKVKPPTRLCLAINDDPVRLHNPAGHLLCYPVKLIRGEPKHPKQRGLQLANDLGPTHVDTSRESELCLPAVFAHGD